MVNRFMCERRRRTEGVEAVGVRGKEREEKESWYAL
jgi:hypothetical protein